MPRVRIIKGPLYGVYGVLEEGAEVEVSDAHARYYEQRGRAIPVVALKAERAPQNKAEAAPQNKAADAGPLRSRGGATGEDAPASLSRAGRPQRGRTSRSSKASQR